MYVIVCIIVSVVPCTYLMWFECFSTLNKYITYRVKLKTNNMKGKKLSFHICIK